MGSFRRDTEDARSSAERAFIALPGGLPLFFFGAEPLESGELFRTVRNLLPPPEEEMFCGQRSLFHGVPSSFSQSPK
jgi:hypothetical protein